MAPNPKATMKCGEVRRSTLANKKVMKLYCLPGGKRRLVHAGDRRYKHNYSDKARRNFRSRMRCDTAKPGTRRHLACTELWSKKSK